MFDSYVFQTQLGPSGKWGHCSFEIANVLPQHVVYVLNLLGPACIDGCDLIFDGTTIATVHDYWLDETHPRWCQWKLRQADIQYLSNYN